MHKRNVCWVLTTGAAGMRSQAMGLAEAVGLPIVEKRIALRPPWSWLPGGLVPMPLPALDPSGDRLAPPWPSLVVGCGRKSIGAALAVKRLSGGRTLAAYVQNPEFGRRNFDLVVAMPHDGVSGANVVTVQTAMHAVTPVKLGAAAAEWRPHLAPAGERLLGVLLGGDNSGYRLTDAVMERLVGVLRAAHAEHGFRATITPSRRTGEGAKRILAEALAAGGFGQMWDGTGVNPYLGILALSERLIVTGESISMLSEALATGRPVHVLPLEGQGRRHGAFLEGLAGKRLVSLVESDDLDWGFAGGAPINATPMAGLRLREMLAMQEP